jgi:hypothetical protein
MHNKLETVVAYLEVVSRDSPRRTKRKELVMMADASEEIRTGYPLQVKEEC